MKVDPLSLSYNVDSSFIRIYTSGAIAVLHSATSTQVVIDNCMFINNSASINEMNRNDAASIQVFLRLRGRAPILRTVPRTVSS